MKPNIFSFCRIVLITAASLFASISCRKWIAVNPPANTLVSSVVFDNDATANSAMLGIYVKMMQSAGSNNFPNGSPSILFGLMADELVYNNGYSSSYSEFFNNALTISNPDVDALWNQAYNYIYLSNAIIEGLGGSKSVSEPVKKQLIGEAEFIRAFCHFYLLNAFGDVPLAITSDFQTNSVASRSSRSAIYQQIITDLEDAKTRLRDDYSISNGGRTRPNKWAASALLSRVFLYMAEWQMAESESDSIINKTANFSLATSPDSVFLKNSPESIWQLMPNAPYYNYSVQDAYFFIPYPGTSPYISIANTLFEAFDPQDRRKQQWLDSARYQGVTYYFPFKYKQKFTTNSTEYYTVLRLAEQYLIRAEGRARQNKLPEAIGDLNAIRRRAGLIELSWTLSRDQVLDTLMHERRIEFFSELGQRWFDLRRTGKANQLLLQLKPEWQPTDTLLPIPQKEILTDPNLNQNAGY